MNIPTYPPQKTVSVSLPSVFAERMLKFIRDIGTGNVTFNVKNGRVLGMRVEEIHNLNLRDDDRS